MNKNLLKTIKANVQWYKTQCPKEYDIVQKTYKFFKRRFPQFPEAWCPEATYVLKMIMPDTIFCFGTVGDIPHFWNYDVANNVFIDITVSQFDGFQDLPILIERNIDYVECSLDRLGYKTYSTWQKASEALLQMGTQGVSEENLDGMTFPQVVDHIIHDI